MKKVDGFTEDILLVTVADGSVSKFKFSSILYYSKRTPNCMVTYPKLYP